MNDTTNMIAVLIVVCILVAAVIGMLLAAPTVLRSNAPNVIGGDGDDLLTGGEGANRFVCGGGEDTIIDYNEAEGDTKTADCENF
jgi:Ca2+-binding RTX toxin-like protein